MSATKANNIKEKKMWADQVDELWKRNDNPATNKNLQSALRNYYHYWWWELNDDYQQIDYVEEEDASTAAPASTDAPDATHEECMKAYNLLDACQKRLFPDGKGTLQVGTVAEIAPDNVEAQELLKRVLNRVCKFDATKTKPKRPWTEGENKILLKGFRNQLDSYAKDLVCRGKGPKAEEKKSETT